MNCKKIIFIALLALFAYAPLQAREKLNYYYESEMLLDIKDPVGDDKGTGFYRYPLDSRIKRGAFDLKRFCVFEEGDVIVFEIQMRNYIMRHWPNSMQSTLQGFVANMWDIYIDIDRKAGSGHQKALPGRDLCFANNMGWEKVIMITPLSESALSDVLRNKTDEISFQSMLCDIMYPDYIKVQNDKVIVKIPKQKLKGLSRQSGFQCFCMGYSEVVSPGRLLNRDVKAFQTNEDFGGGSNDSGEPCVIDLIMPKNESQYKHLRNNKPAMFQGNIRYASVPFVYAEGKADGLISMPPVLMPQNNQMQPLQPQMQPLKPQNMQPLQPQMQPLRPQMQPLKPQSMQPLPVIKTDGESKSGIDSLLSEPPAVGGQNGGFVPLNKNKKAPKKEQFKAPEAFIPVSKKK